MIMKDRYFAPVDRQLRLWSSALGWIGTPFVDRQRLKGAGVDCVQLAGAIYIETGLLDRFEPGDYDVAGADHQEKSRVMEWLEASPCFENAGTVRISAGDLLCFRPASDGSGPAWHVGIVLAVEGDAVLFIHCLRRRGTRTQQLQDETWRSRLVDVFTPVELSSLAAAIPQD